MARISPATPEKFAQVSDHMERWKKLKGYPPNSWLTMVRKPKVFRAYRDLHVAVIALLGWLNRWNMTLATPIEASALAFAEKHLPGFT